MTKSTVTNTAGVSINPDGKVSKRNLLVQILEEEDKAGRPWDNARILSMAYERLASHCSESEREGITFTDVDLKNAKVKLYEKRRTKAKVKPKAQAKAKAKKPKVTLPAPPVDLGNSMISLADLRIAAEYVSLLDGDIERAKDVLDSLASLYPNKRY